MRYQPHAQGLVPVERPLQTGPAVSGPTTELSERLLLLGLGNDILTDDAIGLAVVREVVRKSGRLGDFEVKESTEMGMALLDLIIGFQSLLVVDAIQSGKAPPGHVHVLDCIELKILSGAAPHSFGLGEILALGKELELPVPDEVTILAVEVADPFTLGTELTDDLQAALPAIVERVIRSLATSLLGLRAETGGAK